MCNIVKHGQNLSKEAFGKIFSNTFFTEEALKNVTPKCMTCILFLYVKAQYFSGYPYKGKLSAVKTLSRIFNPIRKL